MVRIKIEMVTVITIAMIMSSRLMIIALMTKKILSIMMIINNYHNHDDTDDYKTKIVKVTMTVLHPIVEVSTFENRYYSFTYTFSFNCTSQIHILLSKLCFTTQKNIYHNIFTATMVAILYLYNILSDIKVGVYALDLVILQQGSGLSTAAPDYTVYKLEIHHLVSCDPNCLH